MSLPRTEGALLIGRDARITHKYIHIYRKPFPNLKEDHEVIKISLKITHSAQERLATTPGSTSPTLFEQ